MKIGSKYKSIDEILDAEIIDGIGPKAEENLYNYIEGNYEDSLALQNYFDFEDVVKILPTLKSKGTVCITGKLKDFSNRTLAKDYLETKGYKVTASLSSLTDYLICEDNSTSSKIKKAESLGIPIVTIANLIN